MGRYARFTPMFGYAWRGHYLTISDGRQTIPAGDAGPIAGLDTHYDAEWQGPWLGFTMLMDTTDRTRVTLDVEYHYADYRAEADWNLRTDLAHPLSFIHETRATGVVVGLRCVTTSPRLGDHHPLRIAEFRRRSGTRYGQPDR